LRTLAEHLSCSLMLLRFVPMRSGSQQCPNVAFTAITRVQIRRGRQLRINEIRSVSPKLRRHKKAQPLQAPSQGGEIAAKAPPLPGLKRFGQVFIPARHDPFPQVAFIAVSRREGAPGELSSKLALPEMLHEISDRDYWLCRFHALVDFDLESSDGLSCRGLVGDLVC
jgi:hypothetical protein